MTLFNPRPAFWWKTDPQRAHQLVFEYVEALQHDRHDLLELFVRNARLYDNRGDFDDLTVARRRIRQPSVVSENVIKSVIDTSVAKIAKNRPRATFQTDGADWSTQRRAKRLEQYVEAMFEQLDVYKKVQLTFRDAMLFGTGLLKVFNDGDKVFLERTLVEEIIVDELECRACPPLQMHQIKPVDKEVLKAMFPEHKKAIEESSPHELQRIWNPHIRSEPNQIMVIESWRPPSIEGAGDGMHGIFINGKTLLWEEYEDMTYPFIKMVWTEPVAGWYGISLAEELAGHQLRINKTNKFIDLALDRVAIPRVYAHVSDAAMTARLDRTIGQIVLYKSKPPQIEMPRAVSGEHYQRLDDLKRSAFEMTGVSTLSAQSKKPPGIEAGVALRELGDIEAQRFSIQEIDHEQSILLAASMIVTNSKEIHDNGHDPAVVWKSKDLIKKIKWSEVDMEKDRFVMDLEAGSMLSRTPAGRLQSVIEMAQAGLIDVDDAKRLLGHPDLKREQDISNAAVEDIEATIEDLKDGKFSPPDPFQNLELGKKRVQADYLNAKRSGAPEDILEGMRRWWEQAKFLQDQQQAELQAVAMATAQAQAVAAGEIPPPGAPPAPGPEAAPGPGVIPGVGLEQGREPAGELPAELIGAQTAGGLPQA